MNNEKTEHWESQQRYWNQQAIDAQRLMEYALRQQDIAYRMLGQQGLRETVQLDTEVDNG